ncbi:MAG: DUF1080 domain-containing protein [Sedimentisphaerales bacterium]|nr:DUF1080 domain-containing protein [Sedimentisphaerales bacterium]
MTKVKVTLLALSLVCLSTMASSCTSTGAARGHADLLSTGLVGWQQIGGQTGSWRFRSGVLSTDGSAGGWLSTVRQYGDFRLSLEFRIAPGGNSGVFIRAPHEGDPAYAGLEIQILDDYAEPHEGLAAAQYTASIYDVQAPSERASKAADEWQRMVITCKGPCVKVVLNGRRVIDTNLTYFPYKYAAHPGLARSAGYIGLQNHGSRVEFRDIRIEAL